MTVENKHVREGRVTTDTVLIAGGGPIGRLLATALSHHALQTVLLEPSETTKYLKMNLTNAKSMEMLHGLDLAEGLYERVFSSYISRKVFISSGLPAVEPLTQWLLPSVE
jgi:FAD-dependent monooxygenase